MSLEDFFNQEKFDHRLAEKLYQQQPGAVVIPDVLKIKVVDELLHEINSNRRLFKKAKEQYGKAQRFFMHYWGWHETGSDNDVNFPLATEFGRHYNDLSQLLMEAAQLTQRRVSSTGIHLYWPDSQSGLDPHRDLSKVQLISSFVLTGYSPIYVADDHELKLNKQLLSVYPGDLLLMRGPRNAYERRLTQPGPSYDYALDPRPIHCVGPVDRERISLLFRHIIE